MVHLGGCIKPNWPEIDSTVIDGTAATIRRALADPSTRAFYQIKQMLSSGLTIRDNMNAAIVTIPCIHGTEVPFSKGALTGLPIAFTPLLTSLTNGATALQVDSTPTINYARTDGYLGLTVNFNAPRAIVSVRRATPKPTIANTTFTAIDFDTSEQAIGTGASWSAAANTRITIASAGQYDVTATLGWNTGAGGTIRRTAIRKNNVSVQEMDVAPGYSGMSLVWSDAMSAADYLELFVYQDSGGALNTNSVNRLQVKCVAPPATYTANVTGILWGG